MKNLKEKLRKNGGFTLVEMLIVVAIIAILIAVSIPMVGSALERSRHAVDQANNRDAMSLAAIEYLTDEDVSKNGGKFTYYVNGAHQGVLVKDGDAAPAGYDKAVASCTCGNNPGDLVATIDQNGNVSTSWAFNGEGETIAAGNGGNGNANNNEQGGGE